MNVHRAKENSSKSSDWRICRLGLYGTCAAPVNSENANASHVPFFESFTQNGTQSVEDIFWNVLRLTIQLSQTYKYEKLGNFRHVIILLQNENPKCFLPGVNKILIQRFGFIFSAFICKQMTGCVPHVWCVWISHHYRKLEKSFLRQNPHLLKKHWRRESV
jgi:hypothetical protein